MSFRYGSFFGIGVIIYACLGRYVLLSPVLGSVNHIYEVIQTFHVHSDERRRLTTVEFWFENLSTVEFVTAIAWLAKIAINVNALTGRCAISMAAVDLLEKCVSSPFLQESVMRSRLVKMRAGTSRHI